MRCLYKDLSEDRVQVYGLVLSASGIPYNIKKMKNAKIAEILEKHPANIWTIYNRAKNKGGNPK